MNTDSLPQDDRLRPTEQRKIPNTLYHVTLPDNCISIVEHGINPAFSKSPKERVYFVERQCLHWAIPFISRRHGCPVDDLVIFKVRGGKQVKPLGGGKWFCEHPKTAHYFDDARYHV